MPWPTTEHELNRAHRAEQKKKLINKVKHKRSTFISKNRCYQQQPPKVPKIDS